MPHTMRGAHSRHSHPLPSVPAAPRPTPCETLASRGERSLLCSSALVFFFLLFSDLGISRRGQGREGRNKKKGPHPKGASQIPAALHASIPPPIGCCGVQTRALSPYGRGHIPTSPALQAHHLCASDSLGIGSAKFSRHRYSLGRLLELLGISQEGWTTLRQL